MRCEGACTFVELAPEDGGRVLVRGGNASGLFALRELTEQIADDRFALELVVGQALGESAPFVLATFDRFPFGRSSRRYRGCLEFSTCASMKGTT